MRWFWKIFFLILVPGLVALFIAVMLMVSYPAALLLAAPRLCVDDKPDAFIVRYDVQTSDGTGTNFTLVCMSERGEVDEVGTWEPLGYLFAVVAAVLYGLLFLLWFVGFVRRLLRGGSDPPGDPPTYPSDPSVISSDAALGTQAEDPFEAIRDQQGPIIS